MKSSQFLDENFVEDAHSVQQDHEVQMAREELYHAAESALRLHKLLRNVDESQGLEGWVSGKITLANDYLRTVLDYMEYELMTGMPSTQSVLSIAESDKQQVAERNGYKPSTEPDTPEQAARRQQSLQAYQTQQQAPRPPMPEEEYQRRLQQYKIGGRGAGYGFQPRPEDAAEADAERAKIFSPTTQQPTGKVDEQGVAEGSQDKTVKIVKRRGRAVGEIGIDPEASPGNGSYYVKLYDGSVDLSGYDTAEEALAELKYLVKQSVAEGNEEKQSFKVSYYNPKTEKHKVVKIKADNKDQVLDYCASKGYKDVNIMDTMSENINQLKEMSAGSVATVVNPPAKNKAKVGTLFGGTYQQKKTKAKK